MIRLGCPALLRVAKMFGGWFLFLLLFCYYHNTNDHSISILPDLLQRMTYIKVTRAFANNIFVIFLSCSTVAAQTTHQYSAGNEASMTLLGILICQRAVNRGLEDGSWTLSFSDVMNLAFSLLRLYTSCHLPSLHCILVTYLHYSK